MANDIYRNCCECNAIFLVPKNHTTKRFCSLSCSNITKNRNSKIKKIIEYNLNPKQCKHCSEILNFNNKHLLFCNHSCSATYNNLRKDKMSDSTKQKISAALDGRQLVCKISFCKICNMYMPNIHKTTCSPECDHEYRSKSVRGRTGGNRDINLPGIDCDNNKFYYDSNWEILMAKSLTDNGIYWTRPKKFILSNGRSYTPDFFLPQYNLYLDPKAKRPDYYRNSILKIEMFEREFNVKCIVISRDKLLTWDHIKTLLIVQCFRS